MRRTLQTLGMAGLLALCGAASAQATGGYHGPSATAPQAAPAPGGYAGPSSATLMTVKQLVDSGWDEQRARLQGRIVSHDGDDHYTFEDATGRISVEIDAEDFPPGQAVTAEQRVELWGEFDKGFRRRELEVDRITLIP